ncbi:hypothetical protein BsWGS_11697 [Bradybaena similaris]
MQSIVLLFLTASCLNLISSGDAEANNVPERSPDVIFDGAVTNENRHFVPLEARNQYDITSAKFGDFSLKHDFGKNNQITNGNSLAVPLNNGYDELSPDTREAFTGSLISKRFNEFVGKRDAPSKDNRPGYDVDTLPDDNLRTLGMWISSPESYRGENENKVSRQTSIGSHDTERLLRHLYNQLRNDDLLKRQYEFVGKRNYDFVGKRSYDFVGKRSPYDFVGKRQPFHFLYRKGYDVLGKRAPSEFDEERAEDLSVPIGIQSISPSWPTEEHSNMMYDSTLVLPLMAPAVDGTSKRYSEFLGKRKRSVEDDGAASSTTERLAALLQDNGLRKRLSRMLLNQIPLQNYPGFVGK